MNYEDDIKIPEEILEAQETDKLVIFVGAGISQPSGVLDFKGLCKKITGDDPEEDEALDVYLGNKFTEGKPIHKNAESYFKENFKPNIYHANIIRLFKANPSLRIVSTNQDMLLTQEAKAQSVNVEMYYAPALPLGRDFKGIVYLHGSAEKEARRMILTDRDFGRAYLTEGWARRFLVDLFLEEEVVVLFIGYSHDDTILKYLARGLPDSNKKKRFAFCPRSDDDIRKWLNLGIQPIPYKQENVDDHEALKRGIEQWVNESEESPINCREHIHQLMQAAPPPENEDYLLRRLKKEETAQYFIKGTIPEAIKGQWLIWLDKHGVMDGCFVREKDSPEVDLWARWIVSDYFTSQTEILFHLLDRHGWVINEKLWFYLVLKLSSCASTVENDLYIFLYRKWATVLIGQPYRRHELNRLFQGEVLIKQLKDISPEVIFQIVEVLIAPYAVYENWGKFRGADEPEGSQIHVRVNVYGDFDTLRTVWKELIVPCLEEYYLMCESLLTAQFVKGTNIYRSFEGNATDVESLHLRSVKRCGEESSVSSLEAIVWMTKELIDWMNEKKPEEAYALIARWKNMNIPLMDRLSLYGLSGNPTKTANEKIDLMLGQGWLNKYEYRNEIYYLLEKNSRDLSEPKLTELIKKIDGYPESDAATMSFEKYNLYRSIQKAGARNNDLERAIKKIEETDPRLKNIHEKPRYDGWGSESPVSCDKLLKKYPAKIIRFLLKFKENRFHGTDREGLLSEISRAVIKNHSWAMQLMEILREKSEWSTDVWKSVFDGWRNVHGIETKEWEKLFAFLEAAPDLLKNQYGDIAWFFEGFTGRRDDEELSFEILAIAEKILETLWQVIGSQEPSQKDHNSQGWLGTAINTSAGKIAEFWLYSLGRHYSNNRTDWHGLPSYYIERFDQIVRGMSFADEMARVILASRLHYIFTLDPEWTRKYLIPLFDWHAGERKARQMFHGFLIWGYIYGKYWKDLKPYYQMAFEIISHEPPKVISGFCRHMSGVAIHINDTTWIDDMIKKTQPDTREVFARKIEEDLKTVEEDEGIKNIWNNWLKKYWERRVQGIPAPLSEGESAAMLNWLLPLAPVANEVVDLICRAPRPLLKQTNFYFRLAESNLAASNPQDVSKLLKYLLLSAERPFWHMDKVLEIFRQLRINNGDEKMIRAIEEQLTRLGWIHDN